MLIPIKKWADETRAKVVHHYADLEEIKSIGIVNIKEHIKEKASQKTKRITAELN
jgi:hypothetical protein